MRFYLISFVSLCAVMAHHSTYAMPTQQTRGRDTTFKQVLGSSYAIVPVAVQMPDGRVSVAPEMIALSPYGSSTDMDASPDSSSDFSTPNSLSTTLKLDLSATPRSEDDTPRHQRGETPPQPNFERESYLAPRVGPSPMLAPADLPDYDPDDMYGQKRYPEIAPSAAQIEDGQRYYTDMENLPREREDWPGDWRDVHSRLDVPLSIDVDNYRVIPMGPDDDAQNAGWFDGEEVPAKSILTQRIAPDSPILGEISNTSAFAQGAASARQHRGILWSDDPVAPAFEVYTKEMRRALTRLEYQTRHLSDYDVAQKIKTSYGRAGTEKAEKDWAEMGYNKIRLASKLGELLYTINVAPPRALFEDPKHIKAFQKILPRLLKASELSLGKTYPYHPEWGLDPSVTYPAFLTDLALRRLQLRLMNGEDCADNPAGHGCDELRRAREEAGLGGGW